MARRPLGLGGMNTDGCFPPLESEPRPGGTAVGGPLLSVQCGGQRVHLDPKIAPKKPRLADWGTGDKMRLNWGRGRYSPEAPPAWRGGRLLSPSPEWPTSHPTAALGGPDALMQMFR